jgi:uncharacterized BrkB/YihY/UPF0761 family membrane protein
MPILFMALIALLVFLVMGGMVFYAAYAEAHTPHKEDEAATDTKAAPHRA